MEAAVGTKPSSGLKWASGSEECDYIKEQQALRIDLLTSGDLSELTAGQIHRHKYRHLVGEDARHESLLD